LLATVRMWSDSLGVGDSTSMKICVTVDLDNYRDYQSLVDTASEGASASFYDDAVPRFLDLFDQCGIRATFFMIGRDGTTTSHRRLIQAER